MVATYSKSTVSLKTRRYSDIIIDILGLVFPYRPPDASLTNILWGLSYTAFPLHPFINETQRAIWPSLLQAHINKGHSIPGVVPVCHGLSESTAGRQADSSAVSHCGLH